MQNYYQKPIQRVSNEFKERFDDFFLANARKTNEAASNKNMMPDFQKQLFINQAIKNDSIITLDMVSFNHSDQNTIASGKISKLTETRFLLKSSNTVSYFIDLDRINFITLK